MKARVMEREACMLRLGYKETRGKTQKTMEEESKKQLIDSMTVKFGNVTVGIHGQELPKFSETQDTQEFWKLSKNQNGDFSS